MYIAIEGRSGVGKSRLLAQLQLKLQQHALSYQIFTPPMPWHAAAQQETLQQLQEQAKNIDFNCPLVLAEGSILSHVIHATHPTPETLAQLLEYCYLVPLPQVVIYLYWPCKADGTLCQAQYNYDKILNNKDNYGLSGLYVYAVSADEPMEHTTAKVWEFLVNELALSIPILNHS